MAATSSVNTRRCLSEDAEGHCYVLVAVCDGSAESRWARVDAKFWKNKAGTCLDSDGTNIYPHQCNKSAYQTWQPQTP